MDCVAPGGESRWPLILTALLVASVLVVVRPVRSGRAGPERGYEPCGADLTQVVGLPPGATTCPRLFDNVVAPFNTGARGTPMTSCPFVEQVRREYAQRAAPLSGPQQMRVASPSTGEWYDLVCTPTGEPVTCSGGVVAVIYLYNG